MAGCPGLKSGTGRCTGCHNGSGGYMGSNGCTGCSFGNSNRMPTGTTTRRRNSGYSSSNSVRIPVVAPVIGSWSSSPSRSPNFWTSNHVQMSSSPVTNSRVSSSSASNFFHTRRAPETRSRYQSNYLSPSFNRNGHMISNPHTNRYDSASSHAETDSVHVVNGFFSQQQLDSNKKGQGFIPISNEDTSPRSFVRKLQTSQIDENNGKYCILLRIDYNNLDISSLSKKLIIYT